MESTPFPFTVNQQGVSGLGRAWFYLTLWRGTPAEFTEEINAEIYDVDPVNALIAKADTADVGIERMATAVANIAKKDAFNMDIITETAVVWNVG